jgi:hypothetical protein
MARPLASPTRPSERRPTAMSTTSTSHRVTKPKTQKRKKKTMSYDAAFPLDPAILASTSTMTPSTASTAMNTTSINDSDLQPQNLTATPSQLLTLSTFIASHPSSNVATTLTAILRTSLTPTDFAALQLAAAATLARERELRQQALLRELDKLEGKVLGMLREGMGRYCFMKDVEKMGHGFEVLEGMEMVSRIWGEVRIVRERFRIVGRSPEAEGVEGWIADVWERLDEM